MGQKTEKWELSFSKPSGDVLLIRLAGDWNLEYDLPSASDVERQLEREPQVRRITFDTKNLLGCDSGFLVYLMSVINEGVKRNIIVDRTGLSEDIQRLLSLE